MWYIGKDDMISGLVEYSSWAILKAYPSAFIYAVDDAKAVLLTLAGSHHDHIQFRQHIIYTTTTFIGDGTYYKNGVGDIGDVTYTDENNRGNYTCYDNRNNEKPCEILNVAFDSSADECETVQLIYEACLEQIFRQNPCKSQINSVNP
jgi:hypothetical protein